MYAQLGNIVFETLTGFSDYSEKRGTNMVQQSRIDDKARLQNTGEKLDEITLKVMVYSATTENPMELINLFQIARANGEILPFVWGNGIFAGNFVITDISKTVTKTDSTGNVQEAALDISLLECVIDEAAAEGEAAKKGFANLENGAQPRAGAFGSMADATTAALLLNEAMAEAAALDAEVAAIEGSANGRLMKFLKLIQKLDKIIKGLKAVQNKIFGNEGLLNKANNLIGQVKGAIRAAEKLKDLAKIQNFTDLNLANQGLQGAMSKTMGASQSIVALSAIRRNP
jgi:phage protein U